MLFIILVLAGFLVASNAILETISAENAGARQFLSDWYALKSDCLSTIISPGTPGAGKIARDLARCEEGFSKIGDSPMLDRMQRIDRQRGPNTEVRATWDGLREGLGDLVLGLSQEGTRAREIAQLMAHSDVFEAEVGKRISIISHFEDSQRRALAALQLSLVLSILALVGLGVWTAWGARRAEEARGHLQAILRATYSAQEVEQRRIALDLHDSIAQELSASLMAARRLEEGPEGAKAKLVGMLKSTIDEVRRISWEMRPPEFERLGFRGALIGFIDDFSKAHGLEIRMEDSDWNSDGLDEEAAIQVYRIMQEILANIDKHARAGSVRIAITRGEDNLAILVEDDGVGFDMKALEASSGGASHLGIAGMRERIGIAEGSLDISSVPGEGTRIRLEVPCAA